MISVVRIPTKYNREDYIRALPLAIYKIYRYGFGKEVQKELDNIKDFTQTRLEFSTETLRQIKFIMSTFTLSKRAVITAAFIEIHTNNSTYGVKKL